MNNLESVSELQGVCVCVGVKYPYARKTPACCILRNFSVNCTIKTGMVFSDDDDDADADADAEDS